MKTYTGFPSAKNNSDFNDLWLACETHAKTSDNLINILNKKLDFLYEKIELLEKKINQ